MQVNLLLLILVFRYGAEETRLVLDCAVCKDTGSRSHLNVFCICLVCALLCIRTDACILSVTVCDAYCYHSPA